MKINRESKKELVRRILNTVSTDVERRRYPRLKKILRVGFKNMDSGEGDKYAATKDVSMGGFRMDVAYFGKPPSVHQIVELMIHDPDEKKEPIKAVGRIAWLMEKDSQGNLEIGIMLTYMKQEDRERFTEDLI